MLLGWGYKSDCFAFAAELDDVNSNDNNPQDQS